MNTRVQSLQLTFLRYCKKQKVSVGVGYKSFATGETAFVNPDRRFSTASVFKVFVLIDLYRRFFEGRLNPDSRLALKDTDRSVGSGVLQYVGAGAGLRLRDYARLMMIISDNTAADVLFDHLGRASVADTISWLGLKNTQVGSSCKDLLAGSYTRKEAAHIAELLGLSSKGNDNRLYTSQIRENIHRLSGVHTAKELELLNAIDDEHGRPLTTKGEENGDFTSPRDLVETFTKIHQERALGRFTDEVMDIMAACETGRSRIRKGIPKKQVLAHKTGTMKGTVNDAGIVMDGQASYVLAVLVNDIPTSSPGGYEAKGERIIAEVSAAAWRARKPGAR